MALHVDKIAIIGGGPSGLVALNEFLHTNKDGSSTITKATVDSPLASDPAFSEIVVFEQNADVGGVWNYSKQPDPAFPEGVENYSVPESIRPKRVVPSNKDLAGTSKSAPFQTKSVQNDDLFWKRSGLYDHLFTNIPNELMRFSSGLDVEVDRFDPNSKLYAPFVDHHDVQKYVKSYVEKADLNKYVRFNSAVEKVFKKDGKWNLVIAETVDGTTSWYTETFDAVVVAIGRFNVPYIPKIEGLDAYVSAHPGVVLHSKAFRNTDGLEGKKVLLVGSSVSAVDLLQYLIPKCKEVQISGRSKDATLKGKRAGGWTDQVLSDPSIKVVKRPRIAKFEGDTVTFVDGETDSGYDEIILATGYHLYYPFLEIPENEGKEYIKITSGLDGEPDYAQTKVDNLYLYTFTTGDPTIVHLGIAHNPLFFLTSESNAIAAAGIWSNAHELPSREEQRKWIQGRFEGKKSGFQVYDEKTIQDFIAELFKFGPTGRYNFVPLLNSDTVKKSKDALKDLFYKFVDGKYNEDTIY